MQARAVREVGWGIVGLGGIAERVARAIGAAEGATLAAVCSRTAERAETFAREFGAARSYSDYSAFLSDEAVSLVYIATPNALHAHQTIEALGAGKHVLVEKPMALTVEDAERMVETARSRGLRLGVGFHLRHHPVHLAARDLLAGGELGNVVFAEAIWGSYSSDVRLDNWKFDPELAGAGSLAGLGVHLIDLLRWLSGQEVIEVAAFADGPSERYPVEFLLTALLHFDGGAYAQLTSSRRLRNADNTVTLYCDGGRLRGQSALSMDPAGELQVIRGEEEVVNAFPARDLYELEVESCSAAVGGGGDFAASGIDGLRSVEVTAALLESARSGRAVTVSERPSRL